MSGLSATVLALLALCSLASAVNLQHMSQATAAMTAEAAVKAPLPTLAPTDGCPCQGTNQRILNVLSFNTLEGLGKCPFDISYCARAVAEMIVQYNVDIAGFQEHNVKNNTLQFVIAELNSLVGNNVYKLLPDTEMITRLKVLAYYPWGGSARGSGILVEIVPLRYAWFFSCHLTAYPYGPYLLRDGKDRSDVLRVAQTLQLPDIQGLHNRIWKIAEAIKTLDPTDDNPFRPMENISHPVLPGNYPVVIMGDFNMPSHRDWTVDTANSVKFSEWRGGVSTQPLDWPVTRFLEDNGYTDVFREKYPNPLEMPGFTWTPMPSTSYKEVHDRIDFIFYRPYAPNFKPDSNHYSVKTIDSLRVEPTVKGPGNSGTQFYSDHRAVFGRLQFGYPHIGPLMPSGISIPKPSASIRRRKAANDEDDWTV